MFVLEAIERLQEQKGNGYSANVIDGSMKTMMTPIQVIHSVHLVDYPHTTFHTSISFVLCIRFYEILLVKGHYNEKHSFGVHIA